MDEIIIDEKKYISSKRAAKVTGYAKDYVGQLCREGRVQAKLVGRAWYVLESAIHDHRFGNNQDTPQTQETPIEMVTASTDADKWEPSRYVPTEDVILPLHKEVTRDVEAAVAGVVVQAPQNNEELWGKWLDVAAIEPSITNDTLDARRDTDVEDQQIYKTIDIRREVEQDMPEIEASENKTVSQRRAKNRGNGLVVRAISALGLLTALVFLSLAALNSGILDTYLVSSSRVNIFAGVSTYIKGN